MNKYKIYLIVLIIVGALVGYNFYQASVIKKLNNQVETEINNRTYYQNLAGIGNDSTRVLRLKIDDLSNSSDKMIQTIDSLRKVAKIARNELKAASIVKTTFKPDSIIIPIPVDNTLTINDSTYCDFDVSIILNTETSFRVSRENDSVYVMPKIENSQAIIGSAKKEYRNKRNIFSRIFHWDWKKDLVIRAEIKNSNDLIEVTDSRIFIIEE